MLEYKALRVKRWMDIIQHMPCWWIKDEYIEYLEIYDAVKF